MQLPAMATVPSRGNAEGEKYFRRNKMSIMEVLKKKGYKINFRPSVFYGSKFEDGTIDKTWTLWILHPRYGCSPTLFLKEK